MTKRFALILVGIVILTALLLSSQLRKEPLRVSGILEADEIRLGSRVGGRVAKVHVQEGDSVKAGDALVELEPYDLLHRETEAAARVAEFQAELDRLEFGYRKEEIAQAKAKVDHWQARLDSLDPQQGPRKKEIEAAEARLQVALAQKELAEQAFERKRGLHAQNAASDAELEKATEDLKVATNQFVVRDRELQLLIQGTEFDLQQARAQLREAEAAWELMNNGFRKEDVQKAKAALETAQAELAAVRAQRDELIIRAPSEATVEAIELQPGDMVAAGAPVLSLVDRGHLWVRAYVPGALDVQVDQRVYVVIDGQSDPPFPARVVFRARQAEFTPSNVQTVEERTKQVFRIKVALEPQQNLWPGMTAEVWFEPPDESRS